jgi:hypothetical protein
VLVDVMAPVSGDGTLPHRTAASVVRQRDSLSCRGVNDLDLLDGGARMRVSITVSCSLSRTRTGDG